MIDTIHIRLHNFSTYNFMYNSLYLKKGDNSSFTQAFINDETVQTLSYRTGSIFHDTNRILPITSRASFNMPSSHYTISYRVNYIQNYIDFNFSVPKAKYKTNIFQFINPIEPNNVTLLYQMFKDYLKDFFMQTFAENISFYDLEIRRIDFCYNQCFQNKNDTFIYLDTMISNGHKYAQITNNVPVIYNDGGRASSFGYKTKLYYFKVYHKGNEFKKNDLKQLQKLTSKIKREYNVTYGFDLSELSNEADKMLRYESSYTTSIFKDFVRKEMMTHYATSPLTKIILDANNAGKMKDVKNFLSSSLDFRMASLLDEKKDFNFLNNATTTTFSLELFHYLYYHFKNKILQYQPSTIPDDFSIVTKVLERNKKITDLRKYDKHSKYKPVNLSRVLFPALLTRYIPIEQLKKFLPSSTYYDLKATLKKFDISTNLNLDEVLHSKPRIDYEDYLLKFSKYYL